MSIHLFIGLAGWLVGVVIGLAGTFLAVVSARGLWERRFMVRAAAACWLVVALYPALVWWAAESWPAVLAVQAVALIGGVQMWSRRQMQIRLWENQHRFSGQCPTPIRRGSSVD